MARNLRPGADSDGCGVAQNDARRRYCERIHHAQRSGGRRGVDSRERASPTEDSGERRGVDSRALDRTHRSTPRCLYDGGHDLGGGTFLRGHRLSRRRVGEGRESPTGRPREHPGGRSDGARRGFYFPGGSSTEGAVVRRGSIRARRGIEPTAARSPKASASRLVRKAPAVNGVRGSRDLLGPCGPVRSTPRQQAALQSLTVNHFTFAAGACLRPQTQALGFSCRIRPTSSAGSECAQRRAWDRSIPKT